MTKRIAVIDSLGSIVNVALYDDDAEIPVIEGFDTMEVGEDIGVGCEVIDGVPVPMPIPPQSELPIIKVIEQLEASQMLPRGTREALLALTVTLASTQGVSEASLYAGNIAYRKIKDFDAQIAALRAQL